MRGTKQSREPTNCLLNCYLRTVKLFTIPNIITLGNLACGCVAIVFAFQGQLVWSAYLVGIAAVLDFLDGFAARALKQHSPIGKDLDSLADMVTFGVVPGVVMFMLIALICRYSSNELLNDHPLRWASPAFLVTLFSALRLAKFNNDTRQSDSFIGVPTPANSILLCSLPLAAEKMHEPWMRPFFETPYYLLGLCAIMSYLLISELPLFSLKFKSFQWKGNELRFSFLAISVIMLVLLKFIALPLIIVLYILLSIANNLVGKKKET